MPARKGKHIAKQLYGDRTKGQPSNDIPSKKIKVSHDSHGSLEGAVFVCGSGDVGQLGLGTDVFERTYPGLVNIADSVIQVCAGGMHTVCVTSRGQVYTFGCNDEGGLGRDTSEEGSETKPGLVHGLERVVQVTAGDSHTAALTEDGKVFAFGNYRDANGSIGLTMKGIQRTPVEVLPDMTVVKIASGNDHLVCLTDLGEIYTIGCAEQGQLGRIAECFSARGGRHGLETLLNPGLVRCKKHRTRRLARFVDVWAGQYNTFAKEKDAGDIYSWGLNNYYQLGYVF